MPPTPFLCKIYRGIVVELPCHGFRQLLVGRSTLAVHATLKAIYGVTNCGKYPQVWHLLDRHPQHVNVPHVGLIKPDQLGVALQLLELHAKEVQALHLSSKRQRLPAHLYQEEIFINVEDGYVGERDLGMLSQYPVQGSAATTIHPNNDEVQLHLSPMKELAHEVYFWGETGRSYLFKKHPGNIPLNMLFSASGRHASCRAGNISFQVPKAPTRVPARQNFIRCISNDKI
mmetsp:Transcript_35369/g.82542  ORF Transcript_35369/g.82542 Transcript_35369/m.82542 type:complete len:230 (-) Transcript_35369:195-884(-)